MIRYAGRVDHEQVFDIDDSVHNRLRGTNAADAIYNWNAAVTSEYLQREVDFVMDAHINPQAMNAWGWELVYDPALEYYRTPGDEHDLGNIRRLLDFVHLDSTIVDPARMDRLQVLQQLQFYIDDSRQLEMAAEAKRKEKEKSKNES